MQTWEHKHFNIEFKKIVDTWKTLNPNYEYILIDAEEREKFISEHFEIDVINVYKQIIPGAYKSDLFRYCYLWVRGGVYVDIDTLCLGNLDDFLLPDVDFIVPIDLNSSVNEGNHNLACGFIASIPEHPVIMRCIQKIIHNVQTMTVPISKLDFTGPGILGRAVNEYLDRDETDSFIGKEGLFMKPNYGSIYFLKFELGTEFVKNINNKILFQNKNGNNEIINLYHLECCKLKNYVSWVQCPLPISISTINNKKKIALMIFGQFRSYAVNLKENIKMLAPLFNNNIVYVFILSDKLGNYSKENEKEIRNILNDFGFIICFFDYVENFENNYLLTEQAVYDSYFKNLKHNNGADNSFIPKLMYRKFILNEIKNKYCEKHNLNINLHVFGRLFDIIIKHPIHILSPLNNMLKIKYEINKLLICSSFAFTILGSSDTLFIGNKEPMDYLLKCGIVQSRGPEIWNDQTFINIMMLADSFLCINQKTYSPEVQYIAHIYFSKFKYNNIRFDFNNLKSQNNNFTLYDIQLDPNRFL